MRILAAIDGSCYSQNVMDAIAHRVWEDGTMIKLVTVIEEHADPIRTTGGYHRIDHAPAIEDPSYHHKNLTQCAHLLRGRLGQQTSVLIDAEIIVGRATGTILTLAQDWPADLIVVGTHGRSGLENLFMGSVSMAVLHQSSLMC